MADRLVTLARAARGADRPALEELLRETVGFLHALARARTTNLEEADVVVTDALTRIAGGFERLRDPQAYPHWAYRILQRCIARRGGRIHRSVDPGLMASLDGGVGPVETAVGVERRARVKAAVAALPPKLREPVMLHFTCGLAYREIATVLGKGVGTVSRRMTKALRLLEVGLGEER